MRRTSSRQKLIHAPDEQWWPSGEVRRHGRSQRRYTALGDGKATSGASMQVREMLTPSGIVARMVEVLTDSLLHMGYEIVRVNLTGKVRLHIQVMIERVDRAAISMEDCVLVHEHTQHWLRLENLIAQDYVLEVSSPGLDRPLEKPEHFRRFCGQKIKLRTRQPVDGQKRFVAILEHATDFGVVLLCDAIRVELEYTRIEQARLVP